MAWFQSILVNVLAHLLSPVTKRLAEMCLFYIEVVVLTLSNNKNNVIFMENKFSIQFIIHI